MVAHPSPSPEKNGISRRTVATGLAWSVPAIALAAPAAYAVNSVVKPSLNLVNDISLADYKNAAGQTATNPDSLGTMNSLGGSERYYAYASDGTNTERNSWRDSNDFRYRVRVENVGEQGSVLRGPIKVTLWVPRTFSIKLFNADGSSSGQTVTFNDTYGPFVESGAVVDVAFSGTTGTWTYHFDKSATTTLTSGDTYYKAWLQLDFASANEGLKAGEWAQASFDWTIRDYNVGSYKLADLLFRPAAATNHKAPVQGSAFTWFTNLTATTADTTATVQEDATTKGTTGLGFWYFDGGMPRNYGDSSSDDNSLWVQGGVRWWLHR